MTEQGAKRVAMGFAVVSALLVPLASHFRGELLTPTFFAGGTLLMVYMVANPRFLVGSRSEQRQAFLNGPVIPIAFILGVLLMIAGLVEVAIAK